MKNVTIYSTPMCGYCQRAKTLFTELNIPFEDIDLSTDDQMREALMKKYQWRTVPMIIIGDAFIGGYDDLVSLQRENKLASMLE